MNKRIIKKFSLFLLTLASILPLASFTYRSTNIVNEVALKSSKDKGRFSSVFDSILSAVISKGVDFLGDNLPYIGVSNAIQTVFKYFGFKTEDPIVTKLNEITAKINEVNKKVDAVLTELSTNNDAVLLRNVFNDLNHFERVVAPIYDAVNNLYLSADSEKYEKEEYKLYNGTLKNLYFGGSTTSGQLYDQLLSLCSKIYQPDIINKGVTLSDLYDSVYKRRELFETEMYFDKLNFYGSITTSLLKGFTLLLFKLVYEYSGKSDISSEVAHAQFNHVLPEMRLALKAIETQVTGIRKNIKRVITSKTISTSSYGYKSSPSGSNQLKMALDLYEGQLCGVNSENHPSNIFGLYTSHQLGSYTGQSIEGFALDNSDFVKQVGVGYREHKKIFNKGDDYLIPDYLKDCGFNVETEWEAIGILGKLRFDAKYGVTWYIDCYVDYLDKKGNYITNKKYCKMTVNWLNSLDVNKIRENRYDKFKAFIKPDRTLLGTYNKVYSSTNQNGRGIFVTGAAYKRIADINNIPTVGYDAPSYPPIEDFSSWWDKI